MPFLNTISLIFKNYVAVATGIPINSQFITFIHTSILGLNALHYSIILSKLDYTFLKKGNQVFICLKKKLFVPNTVPQTVRAQ